MRHLAVIAVVLLGVAAAVYAFVGIEGHKAEKATAVPDRTITSAQAQETREALKNESEKNEKYEAGEDKEENEDMKGNDAVEPNETAENEDGEEND